MLNWKPIVAYMKNKAAELEVFTVVFNLALGISLLIVVFTLFELPPIVGIQRFNENLKTTAAKKYGEPPYGHAKASPLKMFCKRDGIDAAARLRTAGLKEVSEKATLAEVCATHGQDAGAMTAKLNGILIEAAMEETMKEIADQNNVDPHALYEAMLQLQ